MKKIKRYLVLCAGFFTLAADASRADVGNRQTFLPPGAVRLKGYLENDIQNSILHWNKGALPYARFVDFFRNGAPQFALGEMWGKAVRSGSMFYRYTQDAELKRILDETVKDILSVQRPNGSISCTPQDKQPGSENGDLWERKYVMLGMEEYYEWVSRDPAVLESLIKQADCIIAQVGHAPKTAITDLGWSAVNIGHEPCHIESSTLLDPFMRLYNLTGEQRFLDFAAYIVEAGGTKHFNLFEQAYNNVEPHRMSGHYPKAYEMMSLFEGLTEYYRATGNERWKQAFMNLYNNIRTREITIIGNAGADQPYHPYVAGEAWGNTAVEQTNPDITRMMETCVGVTWLKFCSRIMCLTGNSQPVDEIEKYIYNGLLGAMKPTGDGFSYVNLLNGAKVNDHGWGWQFDDLHVTCCNLNGPMALAYIPYIAVTGSEAGPIINLYNACDVNLLTPRQTPLKLELETDYPLTGRALLKVNPAKAETFTLSLRIPAWSEQTVVKINGKEHAVVAGKYADIRRKWKAGDRVEIGFDMRCRLINAPHGSNRKGDHMQAVIRGPIVLARDENTDKSYDQPVTILADGNGFVAITPVRPTLPSTRMEFSVPTAAGAIRMMDYASVNGWNGAKIATWLPLQAVIQPPLGGTDELGRVLPQNSEVGDPKPNRHVALFYFLWQGDAMSPVSPRHWDMEKIAAEHPEVFEDGDHPEWGGGRGHFYFWGEPVYGYYRGDDYWVHLRNMQLLTDAGVDFLVIDATNRITYPVQSEALMKAMDAVRAQGRNPPKIVYYTNTASAETMQKIYDNYYKDGAPYRHPDCWFYLDGKPLIIGVTREAENREYRSFFTFRESQWPTMPQVVDGWPWISFTRQPQVHYNHRGEREIINVSVAQHPNHVAGMGGSAFYGNRDNWGRSYRNGAHGNPETDMPYGYNFQEQWDYALQEETPFIFVTGWNEWVAGRWGSHDGNPEHSWFCDAANAEYSRDIEPSLTGNLKDNYYMQLVNNIRRYKGVERQSAAQPVEPIRSLNDWNAVTAFYSDYTGDTGCRNHPGAQSEPPTIYSNNTGRNDFHILKTAHDGTNIYFYAETAADITPERTDNWMRLYIDADRNAATGWRGYDYRVIRGTLLQTFRNGAWQEMKKHPATCHTEKNRMMITLPQRLFGNTFEIEFKWSDNMQTEDPMDWYINGDAAPEARFNYRYKTNSE